MGCFLSDRVFAAAAFGVGPTVNSSVCAPIVGQDRSKKREASVRRCKALVQALVDVQLGLDEGNSAVPAGSGR